jgi:hypothetical protein
MSTADEKQFAAIQARFRAAQEREETYRLDVLYRKYRDRRPPRSWLTSGEIKRLDALRIAQDKIGESMFTLLDRIGGRDWRVGCPYMWVMTELTYADAITTGPLSAIPPIPYGYSERDAKVFASARI